MCRLYTFRSNRPRKVECELIASHNSLLAQSEHDERGNSNPDGWGLGAYRDARPCVVRQPQAAFESEKFRWEAAHINSKNVVAHVRRATVGHISRENTHPFVYDNWLLAHNGTIGAIEGVRPLLLDSMSAQHQGRIAGDTDSELIFHYLLSLREQMGKKSLPFVVAVGLQTIERLAQDVDPDSEMALNIILTDGQETVSVRRGRTLWTTHRDTVHPCSVCGGERHIHDTENGGYQALAIASEPVTEDEEWNEVPEGTIIHVHSDLTVTLTSL